LRPGASNLFFRLFILVVFLAGFSFRLMIFQLPHQEGDEVIYETLVKQLDEGHGYNLRGTSLLENGGVDKDQYGGPIFYHPPGGIMLFWLLYKLFGQAGYALAQLLSYTIFFASMMSLLHSVLRKDALVGFGAAAVVTAFTPIATHVMNHYWLDGPLLAFTTLAAALFIHGVTRERTGWVWAGGAVLGYAALIKLIALFTVPGVMLLAWALKPELRFMSMVRYGIFLLVPVMLFQLPWEFWQFKALGTFFPPVPRGRPAPTAIATNLYVRYITVGRSPWIYLTLIPRVLWTTTVSLAAWVKLRKKPEVRRTGLALIAWIAVIVIIQIALGFYGYAKLMRYVILITPASVLLFGLVAAECRGLWLCALGIGLVLETSQGIQTTLEPADLIIPIGGGL